MQLLKNFRKENGYSRQDMADKLKISLSFYDKVEFDARSPSQNFLNRFKTAFPNFDMNIFFDKSQHN
ncbi:MAG: helix-turn-helix transcriptional regulator [Selenomonadaceae bacterium]|nr:helix-turn-helix transcriptional regulator [Selenomonadaceae bacterium]